MFDEGPVAQREQTLRVKTLEFSFFLFLVYKSYSWSLHAERSVSVLERVGEHLSSRQFLPWTKCPAMRLTTACSASSVLLSAPVLDFLPFAELALLFPLDDMLGCCGGNGAEDSSEAVDVSRCWPELRWW